MNWISDKCKKKLFWHITSKENIFIIKKNGIKQSEYGQQGKGTYCIEAEDYDALDSVLELIEQREIKQQEDYIKNLIVIEFIYSGKYMFCPKNLLVNSNEGWCVIAEDIDSYKIKKIINIKDL